MTIEEIMEKVNEILVEGFEIEPSLLKPQAHLVDDLDLDSLDGVDIVVALEKEFGCRIEEEEARSMSILKDIYDYIEQQMKASGERD